MTTADEEAQSENGPPGRKISDFPTTWASGVPPREPPTAAVPTLNLLETSGGVSGWTQAVVVAVAVAAIFFTGYRVGQDRHPAQVNICCVHGTYQPPSGDRTTVKP